MKVRSTRLAVEALEDRCVPATVAYGDFNNGGLMDMAAITAPTTITVSLGNTDGSYTVSAILTAPKNRPMLDVYVSYRNGDNNPDIVAISPAVGDKVYVHVWLGNGDGTFDARKTDISKWPPPPGHGGGW